MRISPRLAGLVAVAASAAILGAALLFQYVGGLHPCELCMWQRYGYGAAAALGALAAATNARFMAALTALAFVGEAAVAVFHSGVEPKLWAGLPSCGGGEDLGLSFSPEALAQALTAPPPPRCDEIPWEMFGLSMANYNVLIALGLAIVCAYASRTASQYR